MSEEPIILPLGDSEDRKRQERKHQQDLEARAWLLIDDMKRRKAKNV